MKNNFNLKLKILQKSLNDKRLKSFMLLTEVYQ